MFWIYIKKNFSNSKSGAVRWSGQNVMTFMSSVVCLFGTGVLKVKSGSDSEGLKKALADFIHNLPVLVALISFYFVVWFFLISPYFLWREQQKKISDLTPLGTVFDKVPAHHHNRINEFLSTLGRIGVDVHSYGNLSYPGFLEVKKEIEVTMQIVESKHFGCGQELCIYLDNYWKFNEAIRQGAVDGKSVSDICYALSVTSSILSSRITAVIAFCNGNYESFKSARHAHFESINFSIQSSNIGNEIKILNLAFQLSGIKAHN